jgi:hypothetical protein
MSIVKLDSWSARLADLLPTEVNEDASKVVRVLLHAVVKRLDLLLI